MPGSNRSCLCNRLLRALEQDEYTLLQPYLEPVQMTKGEVVIGSNEPFDYA